MPTAKEDTQTLVDEFMPFARKMLDKYREFLPFGGRIATDGKIIHEGATTGMERSPSQDLIDILRDEHRKQAIEQSIRASCIVYDISIVPPGCTEKQDAIAFEIDHRDSYSRVIVYPYTISDAGEIMTEAAFAVRGQNNIFPIPTDNQEAEHVADGKTTDAHQPPH